ncbi:hypothetical protein [Maritimibacter alkaliphilus]|uniref:hypothetical protein n=1 Tax=Maritimibacter alkaliphilus TaxID=404236 RepID=UPI001C96816F|nr:hypothetical protein [Maritimibacter alkaliphilus]MBY6091371.1 hypothetical protein [Maritimibacter alkaliphilus]
MTHRPALPRPAPRLAGRGGLLRRGATALCLLLAGTLGAGLSTGMAPDAAWAEGRVLTPDEMRATAGQMLAIGQDQVAYDMASALLKRDPDDVQALLLHSRAARNLGQTREAKADARRVLKLASQDPAQEAALRHAASMAMAQALSTEGRRTWGQLWLRRAAQEAPDADARALAVRDFQYLRSRNRWSTSLRFSIAPHSNINNGSVNNAVELYGLPFEVALPGAAQALSGVELSLGITTRYRVSESRRHATDLYLQADTHQYELSAEAKDLAPDAKGSDYATNVLFIGALHRMMPGTGRVEYRLGGAVGASTYGGDHYANFLRGNLGAKIALTRGTALTVGVQADRTTGPRAPHATAWRLNGGLSHRLSGGSVIGATVNLTESRSTIDVADYSEVRVGVSFAPDGLWFGAEPQLGLDWRWRDYDVSAYAPGEGRQDEAYDLYADFTFRKIDYFGFNPSVTFRSAQQWSSVDLFDIDRMGVQIGIRTAY